MTIRADRVWCISVLNQKKKRKRKIWKLPRWFPHSLVSLSSSSCVVFALHAISFCVLYSDRFSLLFVSSIYRNFSEFKHWKMISFTGLNVCKDFRIQNLWGKNASFNTKVSLTTTTGTKKTSYQISRRPSAGYLDSRDTWELNLKFLFQRATIRWRATIVQHSIDK